MESAFARLRNLAAHSAIFVFGRVAAAALVVGYCVPLRVALFGCNSTGRCFTAALSNATAFSVDRSVPRYQWCCSVGLAVRRPRATPVCSNLVYSLLSKIRKVEEARKGRATVEALVAPFSEPPQHRSAEEYHKGLVTYDAKLG